MAKKGEQADATPASKAVPARVGARDQTKGERTRHALLDAAIHQFAWAGLRATSVPQIAREVGITPSAVYAHFPTKQALFEAAVDEDVAGLLADALPEVLGGEFTGGFTDVFRRLLLALPAHPLAKRLLAGQEEYGLERLTYLPSELRLEAGLAKALRAEQRSGAVRADVDANEMAVGLEAIVVALLMSLLQTGGQSEPAVIRGVLAVLEASLRPPTGSRGSAP